MKNQKNKYRIPSSFKFTLRVLRRRRHYRTRGPYIFSFEFFRPYTIGVSVHDEISSEKPRCLSCPVRRIQDVRLHFQSISRSLNKSTLFLTAPVPPTPPRHTPSDQSSRPVSEKSPFCNNVSVSHGLRPGFYFTSRL